MSDLALRERVQGGGEPVDDLEARALEIAAGAAAPNTRRAYATAYRAFARFLRDRYGEASTQTLTLAAVTARGDELQAQGLAASTVALRVSAVRGLAMAVCTACAAPTSPSSAPRRCQAASSHGCSQHPTRGPSSGSGTARSSSCSPAPASDAQNSPASRSPTCKTAAASPTSDRAWAIAPRRSDQTPLDIVIHAAHRGRTRSVPLHAQAHDALKRWQTVRPATAMFVSLRNGRSALPEPLLAGAVGEIVTRHAAAAGVREDRRTAHALRHTFCAMLAQRGVALELIKALAGHSDIRTTQIYIDVSDQRKLEGIAGV